MSTKNLIIGTAGIYTAYLTLSLVNERLFTHQYQNLYIQHQGQYQKDKFKFPDLCIFISSLFCALFSFCRSKYQKDPPNNIPYKQYIILGTLYAINILSASYALLYIPYPIRVVSDKCGYLAAVVVGVYLTRLRKSDSKLQSKKLLIAIMITTGAILFAIARQQQTNKAWQLVYNPDTMWIGYLLMFISISAQALFTDSQAFCKYAYKPTINHFMFTVNIMTMIICIISMIIKGQIPHVILYIKHHPFVSFDIILIGILQVVGQISIYFIVLNFKQHIFPLVSTTRKVFTVLLSIFIFNHKMNIYQWFSLILVFGGMGYQLIDQLYFDIYVKKKSLKNISSLRRLNSMNKINSTSSKKVTSLRRINSLKQVYTVREKQEQNEQIYKEKQKQTIIQEQQSHYQQQQVQTRPWYELIKMQPQDYQFQNYNNQEQEHQQYINTQNKQNNSKQLIRKSYNKQQQNKPKIKQNLVFDKIKKKLD